MNLDFTLNLQDLETLLAKSNCSCHFINPSKTRLLMWKEVKANQTTYHLRIGIQKFNSQEQLDRNGEIYWRFGSSELKNEQITKFNQRQAQAEEFTHEPNPTSNNS